MSKWIRKGDRVKVIAGNDKGKIGLILEREEDRVIVKGINIRKKHLKRTEQSQGARIIEMEIPIHVSNVALCDKEGKKMKIKVRQSKKNGERELVSITQNRETLYRPTKKPA